MSKRTNLDVPPSTPTMTINDTMKDDTFLMKPFNSLSGKYVKNENIVKVKLYEVKTILDKIIPDHIGSYKRKDVDVLLKELLRIDQILNKLHITTSLDLINSDDVTDGPRPEYLKLLSLYNRIEIMSHKIYLDNILECIKIDNNIVHDEDEVCTPLEQTNIRNYQRQIDRINNSKVTQT